MARAPCSHRGSHGFAYRRGRGEAKALLFALGATATLLAWAACGDRAQSPPQLEDEELRQLESLAYVNRVPVQPGLRDRSGVVLHDPERAWDGLNLFARSEPRPEALLMDMQGRVVHRWTSGEGQLNAAAEVPHRPFYDGWQHVELSDDAASLFAIVQYQALLKLDRESRLIWKAELPAHHDLALSADGSIYTFGARVVRLPVGYRELPVLDNTIAVLTADGRVEREVSLLDLLRSDPHTRAAFDALLRERLKVLERMRRQLARKARDGSIEERPIWGFQHRILEGRFEGAPSVELGVLALTPADVIHVNSIDVLEQSLPGVGEPGDLLISLRELSLIAVIDRALGRVRWSFGQGILHRQHQPSFVDDGNILVFDNGEEWSRVLMVDPRRKEIVWSHAPETFWSPIRGGCQQLPNGNVLIADSESGRAFEITREGDMVWEFYNSDLDPARGTRGAIYRMTRVPLAAASPP